MSNLLAGYESSDSDAEEVNPTQFLDASDSDEDKDTEIPLTLVTSEKIDNAFASVSTQFLKEHKEISEKKKQKAREEEARKRQNEQENQRKRHRIEAEKFAKDARDYIHKAHVAEPEPSEPAPQPMKTTNRTHKDSNRTHKDSRGHKDGFSQKEKRKRDLGQANREKSYVEEEKRLLRQHDGNLAFK
eukprot:Platyproteum_vivax@DN3999_c0_g1_i1.p1